MSSDRRAGILKAAQEVFIHYGFQRTSMDAIAEEAGLSRSGLYHHFGNKEAVLLGLVEALQEETLRAAEQAAAAEAELPTRILGLLDAKLGRFYALLANTRHGPELLDEGGRVAGGLIAEGHARYVGLLADLLAGETTLDLGAANTTPNEAAEFLIRCAEGLRGGTDPVSIDAYRERLALLVTTAVAGWRTRD